ncbi:unnamed protein product [Ceutorhynchus assimilis]|uniref:Uncharacterized protein n=1 Tax=Ceutorhynchus assimilis TaxID=467358 RepID=A0A9N9MN87_9CUCU|nr:unnamed protein product [Ceutorhynchus assimilis]
MAQLSNDDNKQKKVKIIQNIILRGENRLEERDEAEEALRSIMTPGITSDPDLDQEFVDLLCPSDPNLNQEFVNLVTPQHIIQDIEMTENEEFDKEAARFVEKGFLVDELDETKKQNLGQDRSLQ